MDKGDERKKQLLRVALDLLIEKGYYGTSTREIARRAVPVRFIISLFQQ